MNVASILAGKNIELVTARTNTSLLDIAKTLSEHRIGCIVLDDGKGGIAGIVSERDLVRAIADAGHGVLNSPVSKYMTKNVITCQSNDTMDTIMAAMTDGRFRHMPVVEDGVLTAVISIGDVVKLRIEEAELEAAAMRDYIATG
jgi:CBS domain-containing protein